VSDNNQNKNNGNQEPRQPNFNFKNNRFALFLVMGLFGLFMLMFLPGTGGMGREIPYSQFLAYLEQGEIASVKIFDYRRIEGQLASQEGEYGRFVSRIPYTDESLIPLLKEQGVRFSGEESPVSPLTVIFQFLPIIIGIIFIWLLFRQVQGGGNKAFTFGKSKAKRYVDVNNDKRISFADVAGQTEAKYELEEVVEFLKNPARFTRMGAKIPKGVLLVGMPGTGKTLLAKATAGEAGVPFFHMSGSDFVEMFVGVGASRVRDLFEQGRKNAPCILFIDELDAVGRTRGAGYGGGHDEREQTLNQMLVEMDGFDTKDGVIMIAATNRPDVLDPALLRPGRFDRQVVVDMPDMKEREAILRIHATKIPVGKSVDLTTIAKATPGASGADIANLVNEAALYAARKNREYVEMEDFEEARDKMLMGVARTSKVINDKDKLATAYHEAGHALLHYYLDNADSLHKVSIVPRGRALGVAISLPDEDKYSRNRGWLRDRIVIAFGGYVAEDLMYGETTTGTQNDLKQATDLARRMVCEWGMSDLGPISFGQEDEPIFLGKEIATHKDYSEETAQMIDQEISKILKECLAKAKQVIVDNKDKLESLAAALVSRETLTDADVREVVGLEKKIAEVDEKKPDNKPKE
jgi:cell division protease FtsH